jgi:hypothetical protein
MKPRVYLEGAGATILLLLPYVYEHLSPKHIYDIYHQFLPVNSVARGLLIDFAFLWVIFSTLFYLLDGVWARYKGAVFSFLIGLLLWRGITDIFFLLEYHSLIAATWTDFRRPLLLLSIASTGASWRFSDKLNNWLIYCARNGIILVSFSIYWIVSPLVQAAIFHQDPDVSFIHKPSPSIRAKPRGRLIWILLDELSYSQAFEHRTKEIELPNLQKLFHTSIVFSNVQPIGYYTNEIVPSLLLSRRISDIRSSYAGELFIYPDDSHRWERFDPGKTVFAEAKILGWRTGVVGWYNPYCRILRDVVDDCFWTTENPSSDLSGNQSSFQNAVSLMINPPLRLAKLKPELLSPNQAHRETAARVESESYKVVQNEDIDFALIHLSVPHPPGIYNRRTHTLRNSGSYLDNLVLADDSLGRLLNMIDTTTSGKNTTLLVSSDHSWRIPMWRGQSTWTEEEEAASHGEFEKRPVLMVRFPGEEYNNQLESQPISELVISSMIRGILTSRFHSYQQLLDYMGEAR